MKNLFEQLCMTGLSQEEAEKSIQVVYQWIAERYPVLAAVARSTVLKESNIEVEQAKETLLENDA